MRANAKTATATDCQSPSATSGRPERTIAEQKCRAQSTRAREGERADGADERADADRGVQVADSSIAEIESWRAATTMNTWAAPKIAVCASAEPPSVEAMDFGRES